MGDRANVILEVTQVWPMLEVVAPAVGDDSAVQYVDFAHAPAVEPRFMEEVLEDSVRADLHVSNTSSKAAYAKAPRNRAGVGCMREPEDGSRIVAVGGGITLVSRVSKGAPN